jgi:predicted Zn-dependent protease
MEDEHDDFALLSPEEKIRLIASKLNLPEDCIIVKKEDINGFTDGKKIMITSGAARQLTEEELAYVLGHEKSHIDKRHLDQRKVFISKKGDEIDDIAADENSGKVKKFFKIAGKFLLSTVEFSSMCHQQEFEADLDSQQKLKEVGYSGKGGQKLMDRFDTLNSGPSFTHPAPKTRKERMK